MSHLNAAILAPIGWVLAFSVFYFGTIVGTIYITRRKRKTRWPFKDTEKLVRGPGESLRRNLTDLNDRFAAGLPLGFCAGVVAFGIGQSITLQLKLAGGWKWLLSWGPAVVVTVSVAIRVSRLVRQRAAVYLGWFGERIVGEKLRPLLFDGYYIFHDMPAVGARNRFNLDHVVIGPAGVTVIEVKTRRKGRVRPGIADHKVAFDGVKLRWPWGDDQESIEQAVNEAEWLSNWIFERTGLSVPVRPVVTLPGWYVTEAPSRRVRVVNPDFLPDAVRGRWTPSLTQEQIDLIARQIELVCRDVDE